MGRARLLVSDFVLSFMWVWSSVLLRIIVFNHLGFAHGPLSEVMKTTFSVANMFFFAFLTNVTHGGAYNPLRVLADAISRDLNKFLYYVGARIPIQKGRTIEVEAAFEKLLGVVHVKPAMTELLKSDRGDGSDSVVLSELICGRYFRGSVVAMILMDKLGRKVLLLGRFLGMVGKKNENSYIAESTSFKLEYYLNKISLDINCSRLLFSNCFNYSFTGFHMNELSLEFGRHFNHLAAEQWPATYLLFD